MAFFTFFGERLYEVGKPIVSAVRVTSSSQGEILTFPVGAYHCDENGEYVYILRSTQGYSRMIYTVSRVATVSVAVENDLVYVSRIHSGIDAGDMVVTQSDRQLIDGLRVLLMR